MALVDRMGKIGSVVFAAQRKPKVWHARLHACAQGYCAPRIDYGEVRMRVANAYADKRHEFLEMIGVIQSLSKDVARATDALRARCA